MSKDERQTARLYVPTGIVTKFIFTAEAEEDSNLSLAKQTLWRQNQEEAERTTLWHDANNTRGERDGPSLSTTDQESASPDVSMDTVPVPGTPQVQPIPLLSLGDQEAVSVRQPLSAEPSPRSLPNSSPCGTMSSPKLNPKYQYEVKAFDMGLSPTAMGGGSAVRGDRVGLTDAALEDIAASVRDLGARLQAEVGAVSKLQGQAPLQTAAINSLRHQQERDRQWVARVEQATGGLAQRVDDVAALLHTLETRVSHLDAVWSARCVALERAVALQGAQLDEQAGVLARVSGEVSALAREREASLRLAEAVGALQMEFATERRTVSSLRASVVAMGTLWTAPLRCQFCTGCTLRLDARNTRMHGTLQLQLEDPTGVLTAATGSSHCSPRRSAHAQAHTQAVAASAPTAPVYSSSAHTHVHAAPAACAAEAARRTHAFTFGMDRGAAADPGALASARRTERHAFAGTDQFSAWLATIDAAIPATQPPTLRAAPSAVPLTRDTQPGPAEPLAPLVLVKPVEHCVLCDLPHCADCAPLAHATLKLKSSTRSSARGSPREALTPVRASRASCEPPRHQANGPSFQSALTPATHPAGVCSTESAALPHLYFPDPFLRAHDGTPVPGSGQGPGYGPVPLSVTLSAAFTGAATGIVTSVAPVTSLPAAAAAAATGHTPQPTDPRPPRTHTHKPSTTVLPVRASPLCLTIARAAPATPAPTASTSGSCVQPAAAGGAAALSCLSQPPLEHSACSDAHRDAHQDELAGENEAAQRATPRPSHSAPPGPAARAGVVPDELSWQCVPASMHPLLPLWYYAPPYPHSWAGELWRHVHVLVKHHHARLEAVQRARLTALKTKLEAWAKTVDARVAALARELRPMAHTHERMSSRHLALLEALRAVHAQVMDVRKFEMSVSGAVAEELRLLSRTLANTLEPQQSATARPIGGITGSRPRAVSTLDSDAHMCCSRHQGQRQDTHAFLPAHTHGAAVGRAEREAWKARPRSKGPTQSPGTATEDLCATSGEAILSNWGASWQPRQPQTAAVASQTRTIEATTTLPPGTPSPLFTSVGRICTSSPTPRSRRAEGHGRLIKSQLDAAAQRLTAVQTQLVDNELRLRTLSTPDDAAVNEYQPLLSNTADSVTAALRDALSQPSTDIQLPSLRKRAPNGPLIN